LFLLHGGLFFLHGGGFSLQSGLFLHPLPFRHRLGLFDPRAQGFQMPLNTALLPQVVLPGLINVIVPFFFRKLS
jgi:hypothetical protein